MNLKILLALFAVVPLSLAASTEPLKTYLGQFQSAEKNDEIIASSIAAVHRFLPQQSDYARKLKSVLADEFKKKFGVSIEEVNLKTCPRDIAHMEQASATQLQHVCELAAVLQLQLITRAESNRDQALFMGKIAYSVLSYTVLSSQSIIPADHETVVAAKALLTSLSQEDRELSAWAEELTSITAPDQVLEKIVALITAPVSKDVCFAGICIASPLGYATITGALLAIPVIKKLHDLFISWNKRKDTEAPEKKSPPGGGGDDGKGIPPAPGSGTAKPVEKREEPKKRQKTTEGNNQMPNVFAVPANQANRGRAEEPSTNNIRVRSDSSSPRHSFSGIHAQNVPIHSNHTRQLISSTNANITSRSNSPLSIVDDEDSSNEVSVNLSDEENTSVSQRTRSRRRGTRDANIRADDPRVRRFISSLPGGDDKWVHSRISKTPKE